MSGPATPKALSPPELEDLDSRYRRPLLAFFFRRGQTVSEAEDLTQEVFYRVLRLDGRAQIEHLGRLLFATAANLLRDDSRRRRTRGPEVPLDSETGRAASCAAEDFAADRVLVGKERLAEVLACLDELPPRTRDIFLLFRLERMKQREIARLSGITVSAVEKHVMRATAHLAARFGVGSDHAES
jgi:RNA polymerase sigma-70 factor (ECF subfamily)